MIPSTTVTGFGSGVQTATAGADSTGSTASYSGSVTQHDVPSQLTRTEPFLGQTLQQRSVLPSSPYISIRTLTEDPSIQNLPSGVRSHVIGMITGAQNRMKVFQKAIEPFLEMLKKANYANEITTKEVSLGTLNLGLPNLKFTAWPRTLNPDLIIPNVSSLNYSLEPIREICRQANIAVQNEACLQDQKDAIISNILTSEKEIESLKNELDKLKNELARLFHESTEDTGRIQSLKKELEDTSHKLTLSQENARGAAEELQNLKSTLERKNIELNTSERKASEAESSIQKLKKQNASKKRKLELSQSEEAEAKVKIRKFDEILKKSNDVIQELSNELKIMTKSEHAKQKKLIECFKNIVDSSKQLIDEKEKVSALEQELYSSEVEFSSLSAEYQVIKDSERKLYAENLKKEEELKNLRHLLEDAEETLRRNQQSLKDRVSAVNVDHGCAKRQEPCTKIPQSVPTNEAEQETAKTLLILSGQSPSDATPELRGLLQKKETAG
ncbi:coiled-coil domain-containing protein [Endozoicomonas euniceicola]|uniref:Uncharacterized protein n=1 Tax=Endozoicomonas euniceicola TaxID=1234143 RepID=A0ABY6H3M7_9GAMM|nr:hypothetical protein [Endozoicomonas euniceicola]UYM18739.1 hypothetical protein NX720_12810 [Endozoicomonas euniceicola]